MPVRLLPSDGAAVVVPSAGPRLPMFGKPKSGTVAATAPLKSLLPAGDCCTEAAAPVTARRPSSQAAQGNVHRGMSKMRQHGHATSAASVSYSDVLRMPRRQAGSSLRALKQPAKQVLRLVRCRRRAAAGTGLSRKPGNASPTAGSSAPLLTPYGWRGQRRMPWRLQARFSVVAQMPNAAAASCRVTGGAGHRCSHAATLSAML